MTENPKTDFATLLEMESMQHQIEELKNLLINAERKRCEAIEEAAQWHNKAQQTTDVRLRDALIEREEMWEKLKGAQERNAKLRYIAEWFADKFVDECWHLPHEEHEVHDRSVLSCCPVIEKATQLCAELEQLK